MRRQLVEVDVAALSQLSPSYSVLLDLTNCRGGHLLLVGDSV
jgi:hypothetical protein